MRIITVNLPESYIKALDQLSGEELSRIYPSRSEAIRVAVREFLIKELEACKSFANFQKQIDTHQHTLKTEPETFVRVPIESDDILSNSNERYRTFRIIKK